MNKVIQRPVETARTETRLRVQVEKHLVSNKAFLPHNDRHRFGWDRILSGASSSRGERERERERERRDISWSSIKIKVASNSMGLWRILN